jgi:hypothetical protein
LAVMPPVYLGDGERRPGQADGAGVVAAAARVSRPRGAVIVYSLFQDPGPRASSVPWLSSWWKEATDL